MKCILVSIWQRSNALANIAIDVQKNRAGTKVYFAEKKNESAGVK